MMNPEDITGVSPAQRFLDEAGVKIVQYSPSEMAAAALEFYNALLAGKLEEEFAKRLTVAFVSRL